jgi:hypothetical protein
LNQRGELAGVLFGSGPGYTSGSYGGRVLKFLSAVVPGGTPGHDQPPAAGSLAANSPFQTERGVAPLDSSQPTALHQAKSPIAPALPYESSAGGAPVVADVATLTPIGKPSSDQMLSPPARSESSARFGPSPALDDRDVDSRVAVTPDRIATSGAALASISSEVPAAAPALMPTALSPRIGLAPAAVDLNHAPPDQLLAAAWKQIGGTTIVDQTKTVLAGIGVLSLLIVIWRVGRQREPEHEDE